MPRTRLPEWFKIPKPDAKALNSMNRLVKDKHLHTVCHEANCPNKGVCFEAKSVTFMILGKNCTRNCNFCNVTFEEPMPVDGNEPSHIAESVRDLGLKHIVITSVTRDDLADGGAGQFAKTINEIKRLNPKTTVEVLIPDMQANRDHLNIVVKAKPDVIGHNLETVSRLYETVRPDAIYKRSLEVLKLIKSLDPEIYTKSGIMVGLGETPQEVEGLMADLRAVGCDIFTIGQYLRPSDQHLEIVEYVHPDTFKHYETKGKALGFKAIAAGPFVRSSFNALAVFDESKTSQSESV